MPSVYFISDLHLGHEKICHFRPGFGSSSEEHDAILVERINETVRAKDKLYILGDAIFTDKGVPAFMDINCKHTELIVGNHDHHKYFKQFEKVHGFRRYKEFWLSHCPVHPQELRGKINIHGHVHHKVIKEVDQYLTERGPDKRYRSVCVEACNGYPFSIDEIRG